MLPARTRKPPTFGHLLALLCLVVSGWLNSPMVQAADILLTGIEGSPGVQSFTQALRELRPGDNVRFQPVAELPPPGELHGDIRVILLDLPSLDWRLQDTQGPPTLVLRISRLQAQQRLGDTLAPRLSLLWSDPRRVANCAWPESSCLRSNGLACCTTTTVNSCLKNCARRLCHWALRWSPSAGTTPTTAVRCKRC